MKNMVNRGKNQLTGPLVTFPLDPPMKSHWSLPGIRVYFAQYHTSFMPNIQITKHTL